MSRRALGAAVAGCLLGLLPSSAPPARAEGFVDLYGGWSRTGDARVSVQEFSPFLEPADVGRTAHFETGTTVGGRVGYWLESLPWLGLALDISSFQAEDEGVDVNLYPVSPLLLLRWPLLPSPDVPKGRLQPYAGIGPSFIIADFEVDFRPRVAEQVSAWLLEVGLDVRAGVAWQVHRKVAVFTEYRFTHVALEYEQEGCLTFACALFPFATEVTRRQAETTLDTHHLLLGISFRF